MKTTLCAAFTSALIATPALACVPMPRNTPYEIDNARAVFVARVTEVEHGDRRACEQELRDAGIRDGDPGSRSCEAFGVATLETLSVVKGEDAVPAAPRAEWTAYPFCYIGWQPQVGDEVLAMIPAGSYTFRDGVNVYVDPFDQSDETAGR